MDDQTGKILYCAYYSSKNIFKIEERDESTILDLVSDDWIQKRYYDWLNKWGEYLDIEYMDVNIDRGVIYTKNEKTAGLHYTRFMNSFNFGGERFIHSSVF